MSNRERVFKQAGELATGYNTRAFVYDYHDGDFGFCFNSPVTDARCSHWTLIAVVLP